MDLKTTRQNSANFSHNNDCADVSTQKNVKKRKIFKILGASSLAFFMGIGTLCGVLLAPMNAQASIGASSASSSATPATSAQTGNEEQGLITPQDDDPVLFRTESGLEVKLANSIVSTGRLEGYAYFTMGKYNGKYINWVIIGYNSTTSVNIPISYTFPMETWYNGYGGESLLDSFYNTSNPAGLAISSEMSKQQVVQTMIIASTTNAISTTEVEPGEFLCLSQDNICNSVFSTASSINMYEYYTCVLKTTIENMYTTTLGLTEDEQALIDPQTFTTLYHDYSTTTSNAYMFPLASRGEKFDVSTYLSAEKRGASSGYWSRSGWPSKNQYGRVIWESGSIGGIDGHNTVTSSYGVRPAFVLKI